MKELEITLQQLQSTIVLHVVGAVDSNTAPELQEALLRATEAPTGARGARSGESFVYEQRRTACFTAGGKGAAKTRRAADDFQTSRLRSLTS